MSFDLAKLPTRPVLFYLGTCPRCRFLSRVLLLASLGSLRRVPLSSGEAERVYARFNQERVRPALLYRGRLIAGWRVLPYLWLAILEAPIRRAAQRA